MAEIGVPVNDKEARRFLVRQHKDLLDVLNLDELKILLYTDEVLDETIQEKLMNVSLERRAKLQELLHYLGRQGEPGLQALICALKNCTNDPSQVQLAATLEEKYQKFHEDPQVSSCSTASISSSTYSTDGPTRQHHPAAEQFPPAPIHVGRVEIPAHRRPAHRKQVVHVKIIVIGPPGSGKTSFMLRYTKDDFDIFKHPSPVVEFSSRSYTHEGVEYMLEFQDTPGRSKYNSIVAQYWRNTNGALVIYDVTDTKSLESALEWKQHLDKNIVLKNGSRIPAILVGNKCDKLRNTKLPLSDVASFCKEHQFSAFFQVSVKSSHNVDNVVEFLVSKVAELGPQDTYYIPHVEHVGQTREPNRCC